MFTPKQTTIYQMRANDSYNDTESISTIATRVYGREYDALRATEVPGNDTYALYDLTEDGYNYGEVVENLDHLAYLGVNTETWEGIYHDSLSELDLWLSQPEPKDWAELRDQHEKYAPNAQSILADLIRRGELPHGHYLIDLSW